MEISNSPSIFPTSTPTNKDSGGNTTAPAVKIEKQLQENTKTHEVVETKIESTGIKNAEVNQEQQQDNRALKQEMMNLAREMNRSLKPLSTSVKFEFGEEIGGLYINVIDATTDTVIRRFPSDEAVELALKMREIVGMMFDKKI